jgi:ATP-dependent Clp protease protease subunit
MPTKKAESNMQYFDQVTLAMGKARRINLTGGIDSYTAQSVANQLEFMQLQSAKPINIRLNSPGGSVVDGFAIYDAIKEATKKAAVDITVQGACMSMAMIILQAGTKRLTYPNSAFMLHEVRRVSGDYISKSESKDMERQLKKTQDRLNAVITGRSKITLELLEEMIERKDHVMTAQEALEHGLIDSIIGE